MCVYSKFQISYLECTSIGIGAFLVMALKNGKILSIVVLDDLDFTIDHTIYRNEYKSLFRFFYAWTNTLWFESVNLAL